MDTLSFISSFCALFTDFCVFGSANRRFAFLVAICVEKLPDSSKSETIIYATNAGKVASSLDALFSCKMRHLFGFLVRSYFLRYAFLVVICIEKLPDSSKSETIIDATNAGRVASSLDALFSCEMRHLSGFLVRSHFLISTKNLNQQQALVEKNCYSQSFVAVIYHILFATCQKKPLSPVSFCDC